MFALTGCQLKMTAWSAHKAYFQRATESLREGKASSCSEVTVFVHGVGRVEGRPVRCWLAQASHGLLDLVILVRRQPTLNKIATKRLGLVNLKIHPHGCFYVPKDGRADPSAPHGLWVMGCVICSQQPP